MKHGATTLDHNLTCTVSGIPELQCNGDLASWAAWAGSDDVDYLEPTL